MTANTEPIFIRSVFNKLIRLHTGSTFPSNIASGLTGSGVTLLDCQSRPEGALITDFWCQPLGAIGSGTILRIFLSDYDATSISLLFETVINPGSASPFVRQELGAFLPEVLSPVQSGIAGKKKGLYIAGNQILTAGLSADLANPLVIGCQGGYY
jgi:hypothetical protein